MGEPGRRDWNQQRMERGLEPQTGASQRPSFTPPAPYSLGGRLHVVCIHLSRQRGGDEDPGSWPWDSTAAEETPTAAPFLVTSDTHRDARRPCGGQNSRDARSSPAWGTPLIRGLRPAPSRTAW